MSNRHPISVIGAAIVLVGVMSVGVAAQAPQSLPAGAGSEIVRAKCLLCHEADLITQQRLSSAGWQRTLDKMIRWGASVTESERAGVVEYLAVNFRPRAATAASTTTSAQGADVFKRSCLVCHQADLVEQQRLSRAGWVREIDKMIRWGATVSDAEKDLLTDYLAALYAPR